MNSVEIFGYISMLVVIWSMTMKDMKWLRIVNSISCSMFIVYGFLMMAYPLVVMNSIVILINVYRLIKGE
jgi:uncharacterized protein with PQ loop repeat